LIRSVLPTILKNDIRSPRMVIQKICNVINLPLNNDPARLAGTTVSGQHEGGEILVFRYIFTVEDHFNGIAVDHGKEHLLRSVGFGLQYFVKCDCRAGCGEPRVIGISVPETGLEIGFLDTGLWTMGWKFCS
jgi:hypothetical protein